MEELKVSARRVAGVRQVLRGLKNGEVACAVVALDADAHLRRQVEEAAKAAEVPLHTVATMEELGQMCQMDVPSAAAAVLRDT